MSLAPFRRRRGTGSPSQHETFDFIETAQYESASTSTLPPNLPLPRGWRQFQHPNGDIYYHNYQLRVTTPDDIRDPSTLGLLMDARDNHLQAMGDDVSMRRMPADLELVLNESHSLAQRVIVRMYSRARGEGYTWMEEDGLVLMTVEEYWSHVAEFPSHHRELPANSETEFVQSLQEARENAARGVFYPFSERQLDMIIARYQNLATARAQGRNVTPSLGWLIGAVMPLQPVARRRRTSDGQVVIEDDDMDFIMG